MSPVVTFLIQLPEKLRNINDVSLSEFIPPQAMVALFQVSALWQHTPMGNEIIDFLIWYDLDMTQLSIENVTTRMLE